ncbi:MAG: hypothetical protein ABIO87_04990 [Chthoniobacterales bacterium]
MSVAAPKKCERFIVERDRFACFGVDDFLATEKEVGRESRCDFDPRRWIGVDRGRDAVCGPAFQEGFPAGDSWFGIEGYSIVLKIQSAPTLWTKCAEGIVFCGDALQIQKQVSLVGSSLFIAGWNRAKRHRELAKDALTNGLSGKDEISGQVLVGRRKEYHACSFDFLLNRIVQRLFCSGEAQRRLVPFLQRAIG